jgi:hypothetical protein
VTTATSTFTWSNTDWGTARAWIDGVHDLIIAAGLVVAGDTGQLDSSTISGSISANNNFGFHVFAFPDTLQATRPIFLRLDYSTDQGNHALVLATVSSATNGSGTLATPLVATGNVNNAGAFQASITSYACYVDGTFSMVLGYGFSSGATNGNCVAGLVIDRARDATGTATAAGYLCEAVPQQFSAYALCRSMYGAASPAAGGGAPSLVPDPNAAGSSEGANVNVFRHFMMVPGVRPSLGCLTYFASEFGALTPFTATVLGSAHTWLPMGVAMTYWSANGKIAHCGAIRWE